MTTDLNMKNLTIDYTSGLNTGLATGLNSGVNSPKNRQFFESQPQQVGFRSDGITSLAYQIGSKSGLQMQEPGKHGLYLDLRGPNINPS